MTHLLAALRKPVIGLLLALLVAVPALTPDRTAVEAATVPNDALGIDHISYGNGVFSADRYKWAKEAGAGWNRWVFYWNEIEANPGTFDYSKTDATVQADTAQGLKVLGILLGTPQWASTQPATVQSMPPPQVGQKAYAEVTRLEGMRLSAAASPITFPPTGLAQPAFADGTDVAAPGKAVNDANPWARYVQRTVARYKGRVQAWEIWNEPDFTPTAQTDYFGFWNGSVEGYARLLQVAYVTIRATDPSATVVMGGMAYWFQQNFFPQLLAVLGRDPAAAANNYYFDVTAWHWYAQADLLYDRTVWVQQQLARAGIAGKRIWITEANLPVCEDPPLKDGNIGCAQGTHRGTPLQQAEYVVQALAYAYAAGVERVFLFQLYDDSLGFGEYYGLIRNDGTPRPALAAAKVAADLFRGVNEAYRLTAARGRLDLITMVTADGRRIRLLWSRVAAQLAAQLPVEAARVTRVDSGGGRQTLAVANGGAASVTMAPATLNDNPPGAAPYYIVGGPTVILVEDQAFHQWSVLEGTVRDTQGRPLGGVQVRAGLGVTTADATGHYRFEVRPGLYDVQPGSRSPGPAGSGIIESVPIWASRSNTQDVPIKPVTQIFFPLFKRGG